MLQVKNLPHNLPRLSLSLSLSLKLMHLCAYLGSGHFFSLLNFAFLFLHLGGYCHQLFNLATYALLNTFHLLLNGMFFETQCVNSYFRSHIIRPGQRRPVARESTICSRGTSGSSSNLHHTVNIDDGSHRRL